MKDTSRMARISRIWTYIVYKLTPPRFCTNCPEKAGGSPQKTQKNGPIKDTDKK